MTVHEQKPDKIQESSVTYAYPVSRDNRYFLSVARILEKDTTLRPSLMLDPHRSMFYWTRGLTSRGGYKSGEEFWGLPGETEFHAHDNYYEILASQLIQTTWFDRTILFADNIASAKSIDLEQLWLRQLLRRAS